MAIFHGILLLIVLLLVPMAAAATVVGLGGGAEEQDPECSPTNCSKQDGPKIKFPFRLKGKQPERCGYPGFDLSCTPHSKYPVLELPFSVNVFVKHIDYKSQTINISDSDPHGCFPRQLRNLNLSASPFQFLSNYFLYENSFINCSQTQDQIWTGEHQIACLSDQSHQVYVIDSSSLPDISCTKMYNTSLPYEIFYYSYGPITFDNLRLNWNKPECGKCEARGKNCRFKNNDNSSSSKSQLSIECYRDKPKQGTPLLSLVSTFLLQVMIIIFCLPSYLICNYCVGFTLTMLSSTKFGPRFSPVWIWKSNPSFGCAQRR